MAGLFGDVAGYTPEDDKRALLLAALTGGLGLLGVRRNRIGEDLSRVGLGALGTYMGAQDAAQSRYMHNLQAQNMLIDSATKRQAYEDDQKYRAIPAYAPQDAAASMPSLSPTPQNAATLAANQRAGSDPYTQAVAQYEYYRKAGAPQKYLDKLREEAMKYAPKYKGVETVLDASGKPVLMQTYENRAPDTVQGGYQPKPDVTFQDLGGTVQSIDKLRVQPGQSWQKTLTPGETQTGAETYRHNLQTEDMGRLNYNLSKLTSDRADLRAREGLAKQDFANSNTLRDEYNKLSAPFVTVRDGHRRVLASAEDPSAAGDMALLFGYMKVLDPGSTVREGEYATAQNAGGVGDKVAALYNRVLNGERLSPAMRADFVKRSGMLYKAQEGSHKKVREQYTELAKRVGVNPDNVIVDFNMGDANRSIQAPSGPTVGTVVSGYRFKGGDPNDRNNWER